MATRSKPLPVYYYTEFNPGAYPEQFPVSVVKTTLDREHVGYDVVDAGGEDLAGKTFKTVADARKAAKRIALAMGQHSAEEFVKAMHLKVPRGATLAMNRDFTGRKPLRLEPTSRKRKKVAKRLAK